MWHCGVLTCLSLALLAALLDASTRSLLQEGLHELHLPNLRKLRPLVLEPWKLEDRLQGAVQRRRLSESERRSYWKDGLLVLPGLIVNREVLRELAEGLAVHRQFHFAEYLKTWQYNGVGRALFRHRQFANLAGELLNETKKVDLLEAPVWGHSDTPGTLELSGWRHDRDVSRPSMQMVTVWVALTEAPHAVDFLLGSHTERTELLQCNRSEQGPGQERLLHPQCAKQLSDKLSAKLGYSSLYTPDLRAGDAVLFDGDVTHREVQWPRERTAVALRFEKLSTDHKDAVELDLAGTVKDPFARTVERALPRPQNLWPKLRDELPRGELGWPSSWAARGLRCVISVATHVLCWALDEVMLALMGAGFVLVAGPLAAIELLSLTKRHRVGPGPVEEGETAKAKRTATLQEPPGGSSGARASAGAESSTPPRPVHYVLRPWADPRVDQAIFVRYDPVLACKTGAIIIVCPGGNYDDADIYCGEGQPIAQWLVKLGITAVVLQYRCVSRGHYWPAQFEDWEECARAVRSRASEWGCDRERVGVIGFSAGGHLASYAAVMSASDCRPKLQVLVYPAIDTLSPHDGGAIEPWDPDTGYPPPSASTHLLLDRGAPPTFLAGITTDEYTPIAENAEIYAKALAERGVPCEYVQEADSEHGCGLQDWWTRPCEEWLRRRGWAAPGASC